MNNNINFGRVIPQTGLSNMTPQNRMKLKTMSDLCNRMFPENDVYISAEPKGELVYTVTRKNPLYNLLDPEILKKTGLEKNEMTLLIRAFENMKASYNYVHNLREPSLSDCTTNIDEMAPINIFQEVRDAIVIFNSNHRENIN